MHTVDTSMKQSPSGHGEPGPVVAIEAFTALCEGMPVLDVRSPAEFSQGHVPGAVSFPLLSDEERCTVGTLYKHEGRDTAFARGLEYVLPKTQGFLSEAARLCEPYGHRRLALYCWRGGERSSAMARFLEQAGFQTQRLQGGYKAYRGFALSLFTQPYTLLVLSGKTGTGKTAVLSELRRLGSQVIDLEHLARHRGSAFGAHSECPQPKSEHFENRLALALWNCDKHRPIWVEDESQKLGRVRLPQEFFERMRGAQAVLIEADQHVRLARILDEYSGLSSEQLADGLERILQRLGSQRHRTALSLLDRGELPALATLLLDYYDKGYDYQARQRNYSHSLHLSTPGESARLLADWEKGL